MNPKSIGTATALLLALAAAVSIRVSFGAQGQQLSSAQQAVWNTVVAWNDAFERNDTDAFFRFIDPEITVITPGNPFRISGVGPDRQEFEFSLQRGTSRVGYFQEIDPQIAVYGDVAVVTYYSRGHYGGDAGKTAYYKETDVLVRRDQSWKIVHIHLSSAAS